jgi:predicted nucleotide-binding protein (sugar kinase/HSP70/actin superfamily)
VSSLRVAFPPLGSLSLIAEGYLRTLGLEVISPPEISRRTLDLGVAHCPEMLCIPCKLLFGNYLEAAELGANTIIMLGGAGTCRLGYSVAQHTAQLSRLGYACRVHTFDLLHMQRDFLRLTRELTNGRSFRALIEPIRMLIGLMRLIDQVEATALMLRPRELESGATDRARDEAWRRIAALRDRYQLQDEQADILSLLHAIPHDPAQQVLRLGLVGDLYTILTPFLNLNLEKELGRLGAEVRRCFRINVRIAPPLPGVLRRDRGAQAAAAGSRYLGRDVGGFARGTVGEAALMAGGEVDGLIHVAPFNCTPEIVAQSALVALQREQGVPVLNLSFDEQTGRAGVLTRLEAFVDMLLATRRRERE